MKVGTDAMLLGSYISSKGKQGLDIGTGTGVLSLMIAQKNQLISIDAVEIDMKSSEECEKNFANSPWNDRLSVFNLDFTSFKSKKRYDIVFSNPPYYATTNLNDDFRKAQSRHEESLPSEVLLRKVGELLASKGEFWVIIPFTEKEKWELNGRKNGLVVIKEIKIKGKPSKDVNRVIFCFSNKYKERIEVNLTVRKEDGKYSDEYIALTKEYHAFDLSK